MAFKPIIRDPLSRTYAMTDAAWEFDAPKFYDFSRVDDEEDVHEFDYFCGFYMPLQILISC